MLQLGDISKVHGNLLKAVELWEAARPLFEHSSQAKQVQCIAEKVANVSEDVLKQYRNNLARLLEFNAPAGTVEKLEGDLFDIEDLAKIDIGDVEEPDLIAT
jgi:tRNA(Ile)-lysidine synthase TilS/MesJ